MCPKSTAFVATSAKGIIGPFSFENHKAEREMMPLALMATNDLQLSLRSYAHIHIFRKLNCQHFDIGYLLV